MYSLSGPINPALPIASKLPERSPTIWQIIGTPACRANAQLSALGTAFSSKDVAMTARIACSSRITLRDTWASGIVARPIFQHADGGRGCSCLFRRSLGTGAAAGADRPQLHQSASADAWRIYAWEFANGGRELKVYVE